jgi:hypothetical protein
MEAIRNVLGTQAVQHVYRCASHAQRIPPAIVLDALFGGPAHETDPPCPLLYDEVDVRRIGPVGLNFNVVAEPAAPLQILDEVPGKLVV